MVTTTSLGHTILVTTQSEARSRYGATVAELDVLELVRSGALTAFPLDALPGSIRLALPQTIGIASEGTVEITDLEGVPVALAVVSAHSEGLFTHGEPRWLSARSSRPFEHWHVGPEAVADHTGLVAFCAPVSDEEAREAIARAGSRPLLLALVSLDGGVDPIALGTARQLRELAEANPEALTAIAPSPPTLTHQEREAIILAYARGRAATILGDEGAASGTSTAGTVLFFTGLSGSGKSTIARAARNRLVEDGERVTLLDGDVVRRHLSAGLGFAAADRDTNIRRIGWVAAEIAHHGGVAICSPIAPFERTREEVRQMATSRGATFILVHIATPLAECERRDRKGLYARARRGEIPEFTGISSPYEVPDAPELRLDTTGRDVDVLVDEVLSLLGEAPHAG